MSAGLSKSLTAAGKSFGLHAGMSSTCLVATPALPWAVFLLFAIRAPRLVAKGVTRGRTAAYPEQPREVHSYGCRRFRMQRVGNVYPGTYLACLGHAGDKCERQRGASGAFRSNNLADGADRQSAVQQEINLRNASRSNRVGNTRQRSERRRDFFRQGSFYLCAQMAAVGMTESSLYFRLLRVFVSTMACGKNPDQYLQVNESNLINFDCWIEWLSAHQ